MSGIRSSGLRSAFVAVVVALLASACATPVGVSRISPSAAYQLHAVSALSSEEPSEPSKTVLRRLGLMDRFDKEPATVLAELHKDIGHSGDDDELLFALAELSFLHGERSGDRAYFLGSAVYAYALLFPGQGDRVGLDRSDPRLRLAYDLYNQGVAQGLSIPSGDALKGTSTRAVMRDENAEVQLQAGTKRLPFGTLTLDLDATGLTWGGYQLEHFVSTTTFNIRGLRNRYRRPGIGAALAASLANTQSGQKFVGAERIGPRAKVPVTAFARLDDVRAGLASGRIHGRLEVYSSDRASTVTVDGRERPLEFDSSAALAYQLDKSPLYSLELLSFLRGGMVGNLLLRDNKRTGDGLFTMQPYQRGKFPLVLVHGTASSPVRWAELFNELEGDPRIRDRFQIWVFLYDTGNPVGYSAGRLRAALTAAVTEFDPAGTDPALHQMVVIGHSQGGLLTKLTAIDTGDQLWDRISSKPFDQVELPADTRQVLQQSMFFKPLPFVSRAVFISTPHRGAMMAGGRLGQIASSLVRMPTGILGQLAIATAAATSSKDDRLVAALSHPPTAVDNMNPNNPALKIIEAIPVARRSSRTRSSP